MGTTLIRGARIIDGTGTKGYDGGLLIEADRIAAIIASGQSEPQADAVIDAAGCVVSPGFIDMHSHADWLLPVADHRETMKCLVEQGVTTVVAGNCGFSPAPVRPQTLSILDKSLAATIIDKPLDYSWNSMGEFLDRVEETAPIVNIAELVGHSTLRLACSDARRGPMSELELKSCIDEMRRSFDQGACGLSFGLGYDPGMYSPLDEIEAFCKAAAKAGKPVTVHLKALSIISPTYSPTYLKPHNVRALREMIDIALNTGVKLQLSHFIYVGRRSWRTFEECLSMVESARRQGCDVMIDAFPYTAGNTTINVMIPYWFLAMGQKAYKSLWARARLRAELEIGFRLVGFIYKDFQVMNIAVPEWEKFNGYTIEQIAREWKKSSFETLLHISERTRGEALMLYHTYSGEAGNEEPLEETLSHNSCLFETDAIIKSGGYPNPAAMGTFPRVLGVYSRDRQLFGIEDAIKRMTAASAERFDIKDRGVISVGKAADLVVFDPKTITDSPPAGTAPAGKPKGIKHVFINGAQVVKDGNYIELNGRGRVLRI